MNTSLLLGLWLPDLAVLFALFKAIMGVGFVIFIHELGHFLVAKACGVKCEKFYVGFDPPIKIGPLKLPRTLMKFQWGETEYGVGIIPLGGYVKMLGQDDNPGNAAAEAERSKKASSSEGDDSASTDESTPEKVEWDPRSYPAKNVPQRMAIISAGVTMNAITAVLFAAIAFKMGVSFTPCEVGSSIPGDPAWLAGIQPGDKILQIGEKGDPSEYLRYSHDFKEKIFLNGNEAPVPPLNLLIRSEGETEPHWVEVAPRLRLTPKGKSYPTLGILAQNNLMLGRDISDAIPAGSTLISAAPHPEGEAPAQQEEIESYSQFLALLSQHPNDPLLCTFEVEDDAGEKSNVDVEIAPTPLAMLGIQLEMGPIAGLFAGGPADVAGLKVGDVITAINGTPVGDPLLLNDRLLSEVGNSVDLQIQRGTESVPISIAPELPNTFLGRHAQDETPLAAPTIGIAFETRSTIAAITPNSPAASSGLQPGDQLTQIVMRASDAFKDSANDESLTKEERNKRKEEIKALERLAGNAFSFRDNLQNWGVINGYLQGGLVRNLSEKAVLEIEYVRGTEEGKETISAAPSDLGHAPSRDLVFQIKTNPQVAASFGEAMALGFRQVREDGSKIFVILNKLITGQVGIMDLGGLPTIVVVATTEAKEGISRLLLFLTMLSINLAILNMLPIPVLDGGHMLFLAYEGIFKKPVNDAFAYRVSILGLSFLLLLMLFVTGKDIVLWIGIALQG